MNSSVPFFEVFSDCGDLTSYADVLKHAVVRRMHLDREALSLMADLSLETPVESTFLREVEGVLKQFFGMNTVVLTPSYPMETLDPLGIRLAISECALDYPAAPLLKDATHVLEGTRLILNLKLGGADFFKAFSEKLSDKLFLWYGERIAVELRSTPDIEALLSENEEEKHKLLLEEIQKTPSPTGGGKGPKKPSVLFGRAISGSPTPIADISLDTGSVIVEGEIFAIDNRELKNRGAVILKFDMADKTGAIRVSSFLQGDRAGPLLSLLEEGMAVAVQGQMTYNKFESDFVLEPKNIMLAKKEERTDDAPVKRVELHAHTQMSQMDAIPSPSALVARAAAFGHPAVAITDHGVVQAFPEAMAAAKKHGIKVLYGCEAYFLNDVSRVTSVFGDDTAPLEGEFVAFDLETTGLNASTDAIIEIGAVLFRDGEVIDRFNTFVDPGRPIPPKITELTGINGGMVRGAPKIEDALRDFLAFAGNRVLAAHNASFDIGFVSAAASRLGIPFEPTYVDTRNMARGLLKELSKFDLHTVAVALKLPEFQHHRASDDAEVVAQILFQFFARLREREIDDIQGINAYLTANVDGGGGRGGLTHMILLVRNQKGLRNLYELVSDAHLKYFRRFPIVPRSRLDRLRDGLLVGSACEAGELYTAILSGRPAKEVKKIASYYDFLEVQPIDNNEFLVRQGKAKDFDELKAHNRTIVSLGEELNIPVCATCDVHFLDPADELYRRVLQDTKDFEDTDRQPPLFFRTTNEMLGEFLYLGEEKAEEIVITNPRRIADLCDDVRPIKEGVYSPEIEGSADELRRLVAENLLRLYGKHPPEELVARVNIELESIIKHHFDVIYIIAQKLVSKSLSDGYLVGSRGSVGSSVVAFFAGITEVNALPPHYRCPACKHTEFSNDAMAGPDLPDRTCPVCGEVYEKDGFDIPFATFLGFDGDKKPDIDLNFSGDYQSEAHRHTIELFGEKSVFRAGTIGTIAKKTAFGYVKSYLEKRGKRVSRAEESRLMSGCVGVKRTTGQHPGGLIVVPKTNSIYEFCPIQHPADKKDAGIITTHFDYHSIEENLLKLDLLGHDDPTMIRMLHDRTGVDPQTIPLDDKETMSLFTSTEALGFEPDEITGEAGTIAIPEFGTGFVRGMLQTTAPTTFDELLRISGLSHGTDVWLNNAKDLITDGTATLKEIIALRDDIMNYLISMGLDPKLSFSIMERVRKGRGLTPEWEAEMKAKDVPQWYIDSCNKIKYMFPKAHAAAYVLMAFRIAWFKVHYPKEFYSAYFTIRAPGFESRSMLYGPELVVSRMREIQAKMKDKEATAAEEDIFTTLEVCYEFYKRGFTFEPLDLYKSSATEFTLTETGLCPPFVSVGGLGGLAAENIVVERERGPFLAVDELSERCPKVTSAVIELLRSEGVLAGLPESSQMSLF
ncbi:PolC-type DNA polymerase III [Oscillospiraceae bacterium OttesenSCG-928-G22]|nr:PolC-type DNA polymerase III [Oscillospiraceae bacterium OttesenSCG-928-G22]